MLNVIKKKLELYNSLSMTIKFTINLNKSCHLDRKNQKERLLSK